MRTHLVKCIIVDDDSASLKIIEALIQKTPFLELSASFSDPIAAADYLSKEDIANRDKTKMGEMWIEYIEYNILAENEKALYALTNSSCGRSTI